MMGMTRLHPIDEANTNDKECTHDEFVLKTKKPVTTDEGMRVIHCSQSMTWAVTKSTRQTVGSLLKAPLLDQRRYQGKH